MLAPSTRGGLRPSKRVREQVTGTEMSATASRSVRNTVFMPGRRLTWATWPSTHTAPRRSTQPAIAFAICRTGAGDSREVSRAMRARLGDGGDVSRLSAMSTDMGMPPILSPEDAEKAVLLAAPRGYCAGVDRAVITVEKALDLYGAPVYVRKQIVHNKHVVSNLESRGAVFVEELGEVPEGATVVFSAHGVSPTVHAEAAERGLKTIDATCPLVTKVHHEAKRFAGDDYDILLIGHAGHEEVDGTSGEAPEHIQLVQGPDDV